MTAPKKFTPPALDEWMFYADSIGWLPREDAEAAYDHYLAVGWKVGGQPMRDWEAAARNCKRRSCGGVGAFRGGGGAAGRGGLRPTLGALQMQLKKIEEELQDLIYPGGCAHPQRLEGPKLTRAADLRTRRDELKHAISKLPL